MRIVIQPYYFWEGHYKKYTSSLCNSNTICLITSHIKSTKNKISLRPMFLNYRKSIFLFTLSRIFNSLNTIIYLKNFIKKNYIFHFVEFEPISKIIFLIFNIIFRKKILFTIHSTSISRSNNPFINFIKIIQRVFFIIALILSNFSNCKFVVHNKYNIIFLKKFILPGRIFLISYPCDTPVKKKKMNNKSRLLVFGQFREDKEILSVFKENDLSKIKITFAGKFFDLKLLNYLKNYKNFKIINKFISPKELKKISLKVNFFLIPYGKNYSGSAGPMKESFSFGCPIISTENKIFKDYIAKKKMGFFLTNNIYKKIKLLSKKNYQLMSEKCLTYARKNNWDNLLDKYLKIYNLF